MAQPSALLVTTAFPGFAVGTIITDAPTITAVLSGPNRSCVVGISLGGGGGPPVESITLGVSSAVTGMPVQLAGAIANATPTALDYSIDGGTTWAAVGSFALSGGNFTGTGPTYAAQQSFTIIARDHGATAVQSAPASATVTAPGSGWGGGGSSSNGTLTLKDGSVVSGLGGGLSVGNTGLLGAAFGTTAGTVADGGALTLAAAAAASAGVTAGAALPAAQKGAAGGVAPLGSGGLVPAANLTPVISMAFADVVATASVFHRAPVPTPPATRPGMVLGDRVKIASVFNFGEVWDTETNNDAWPKLQAFLLYCQMMALTMKDRSYDNNCFRMAVDCYLPRGFYFVSQSLIIPEYVRIDGPGLILRTPYTGDQSNNGTTSTTGQFYAATTGAIGEFYPTVVVTPRAHAGRLNVYTGNASVNNRGCGVAIGKFWSAYSGGACTIGAPGIGYAVGDIIYPPNPFAAPYAACYMQVTAVGTGGLVTAGTIYTGDLLGDGHSGCGAYGLPPALQIQQWTPANGFSVFDPTRPGYFVQSSTINAAHAAGAGTGCTFLPTWAADFAGGAYNFGCYGQGSPVQADTIIEHINITGSIVGVFSQTYGPTYGVMVMGLNGIIDEIELIGGSDGVFFKYANDWRLGHVNTVASGTGIYIYSSGSIQIMDAVLDTCGCALVIDESGRIIVRGMVFFEQANLGGPVFPDSQGNAVIIGKASSATYPNVHLDVDLTLVNMGGIPQSTLTRFPSLAANGNVATVMAASLSLAYCKSSRIKLLISNWDESGTIPTYLPTNGFVTFGAGVDPSNVIEGEIDGITGPACIGNVASSFCDVRIWDASANGRAGPLGTYEIFGAGAPTAGASGTGAGKAGIGSRYVDTTAGGFYRNTGTLAAPVWTAL